MSSRRLGPIVPPAAELHCRANPARYELSRSAGGGAAVKGDVNREQWLAAAVELLTALFPRRYAAVLADVHALCSFPSKGGLAPVHPKHSQSWSQRSPDGRGYLIMISPCLSDPVEVIASLVH